MIVLMPIPVAQLQEAQEPLETRLLRFLESHLGEAYSVTEIYAAMVGIADKYKMDFALATATAGFTLALLAPVERSRTLEPYMKALSALATQKKILHGKVGDVEYYAAVDG